MHRRLALTMGLIVTPLIRLPAQHPLRRPADAVQVRASGSQPVVRYLLRVDSGDLPGFHVTIACRNVPDTFRLAMVAHPEYDDRYWRYVTDLSAEADSSGASITREDSALWRVVAPARQVVIRYRIRIPDTATVRRAAWRPFLTSTGGLLGGPHAFMYVVGETLAPVRVTLDLPDGWEAATGLEPTADPRRFFAPSVGVLVDSPILVGRFRTWRFSVDDVPHRVVYWPAPDATPFDTVAFVGDIARLVRQAIDLFGRAPYREYTFLIEDGTYGALEHRNSVTIGAPSADLARNPAALLPEIAHEFFHTWNLMRIHPAEYGDVDYRPQPRTRGLWFGEGLTMFYADLLLRRAGVPLPDSTRPMHLARLMERYFENPGNYRIAPESVSLVTYGAPPTALGDFQASVHLQGELLGAMLDLLIRDATGGRKSMDDVMRTMLERFGGASGYTTRDIAAVVAEVCGCSTAAFVDTYVRRATPIDFDHYLNLIGLRALVSTVGALDQDGNPLADRRIYAWVPPGAAVPVLLLNDPASAWGRAGLHTGDTLFAIDDTAVATWRDFRARLQRAHVGDTLRMRVARGLRRWTALVPVTGYARLKVRIEERLDATARQRTLRSRWLTARP
jgi:predicted metalloprotease with PDZ domain